MNAHPLKEAVPTRATTPRDHLLVPVQMVWSWILEKEVMVACAEYDVINLCRATILKVDCAFFYQGQHWFFCYPRRPFETHRSSSPTADDIFSAVLKTLESDVFC